MQSSIHFVKDYCQSHTHTKSEINGFSAFLCVWRYKNLESLKFFLRNKFSYLRAHLAKAECLLLFFPSWIPLRVPNQCTCGGLGLNPCTTQWWVTLFVHEPLILSLTILLPINLCPVETLLSFLDSFTYLNSNRYRGEILYLIILQRKKQRQLDPRS